MSDRPLVLVDTAIPDPPIEALGDVADVVRYDGSPGLDSAIDGRGGAVVGLGLLLTTPLDAERLRRMPSLAVAANYAVGVDNIDLAAAAARGVAVGHTPDVLTEATADLTWALVLAVARRVVEGDALVRSGRWEGWHPRQLLGLELAGATLAILGLGRIGAAVAGRARGFGMRAVYWSRSAKPDLERRWGLERLELDAALAVADVVSIHLPLTPATRHLVDAARIARMRSGAILVNTSRGPIVDEAALAEALESGRLLGVGLDVYEREPAVHPRLVSSPRTVLLPHLGSATEGARMAMARIVAANLRAAILGEPLPHPVGGEAFG